jgi:hypothetical protein
LPVISGILRRAVVEIMGEPDCSRPAEKPEVVRPLQSVSNGGEPYTRRADVEAAICQMLARPVGEWPDVARKRGPGNLPSEALVFLIRTIKHGDQDIVGALFYELVRRTIGVARRWARGFDCARTEDILSEVQDQVVQLLCATTPTPQSEFLEVAFGLAVRNFTLNVVAKVENKPELVVVDDTGRGEEDEPQYLVDSIPDTDPGPEDVLLQLADKQKRAILVAKALAVVKDRRHVEAVILRYVWHWPITDKDPTKPTLEKYFGRSERQIRNWINGALAAMQAAIGDSQ